MVMQSSVMSAGVSFCRSEYLRPVKDEMQKGRIVALQRLRADGVLGRYT